MKSILKEFSLSTVRLYGDQSRQFLCETRCVPFTITSLLGEDVNSEFDKVAIQLWPIGQMAAKRIVPVMKDPISKVLVSEMEYDLEEYYSLDSRSERNDEVSRITRLAVKQIPDIDILDKEALLAKVSEAAELDFVFRNHFGSTISSPDGQIEAMLWAEFDNDAIRIGVEWSEAQTAVDHKIVIVEYPTFDIGAIYEIGAIRFTGNRSLVYEPKSVYDSVEFSLGNS